MTFTGEVWSRGAEEDSVRIGEDHEIPADRMKWATWKTVDGALFTYERLEASDAS